MPIDTPNQNPNPTNTTQLDAKFNIYTVPNTDPNSFNLKSNIHFVAPPDSVLNINLDRYYHSINHTHADGANRITNDYGHYFTITDNAGNIIASGVIDGINFTTVSIGIATERPVPNQDNL